MKKLKFKTLAVLMTSMIFLTLAGCGGSSNSAAGLSDADSVAADKVALEITLGGTDADLNNVTTSLQLLLIGGNGSTITWSSSTPSVIADNGTVTCPSFTSGNATITLTATITKGADTQTKIFTVIVLKAAETDTEMVAADMANVVDATLLGTGSTGGIDINHVTGNLSLPVLGSSGSAISWSSNNLTAIANNGTVTLPSGTNSTVTLTATFTKGSIVDTKTFTVTVLKYDFNVTFDSRTGSAVDAQLLASGGLVTKPADPSLDDNVFSGWYTEEACTTAWNFASDTVTDDITLYAKWTAATASGIDFTLITSGTEYQVSRTESTHFSGDVVIPAYHQGLPVTAIADSMFNGDPITSVLLPNSIRTIGYRAFYHATGLTSITLPTNLTIIGEAAFMGCTGLTSISIPAGVTTLGRDILYECTGLTSLTLPGGLTSIDIGAVRFCSNLTTITIPNGVTSIGDFAFGGCSLLANVVVIPATIPTAGAGIFDSCAGTLSIIVPAAKEADYKAAAGWITYAARIKSIATQETVNAERDKITVVALGSLANGGNALTKAQTLVNAGYIVSIVSSTDIAAITTSGSIVGETGTSSDVTFRVSKDSFTADTAALTLTVAADYYVSPSGNDGNSGLKSAPLITIQAAITKCSGTATKYIYVAAGTYTLGSGSTNTLKNYVKLYGGFNSDFSLRNNTDRTNPVYQTKIVPAAGNYPAIFTTSANTNIVIDGFYGTSDRAGLIEFGGANTNIVISNNSLVVAGAGIAAHHYAVSSTTASSSIMIRNNIIDYSGKSGNGGYSMQGMDLRNTDGELSGNNIILANIPSGATGKNIGISYTNTTAGKTLLISDNTINLGTYADSGTGYGLWLWSVSAGTVIAKNNTILTSGINCSALLYAMSIENSMGFIAVNNTVLFNGTNAGSIYAMNTSGTNDAKFYNNSIYLNIPCNSANGFRLSGISAVARNNIVRIIENSALYGIQYLGGAVNTQATYNYIYTTGGGTDQQSSYDATNIVGTDPVLNTADDLKLQASSPENVKTVGLNLYSENIYMHTDKAGAARSESGTWSIGAYVY